MELNRIIKYIITIGYIFLAVLFAAIAFRSLSSDILVGLTISVVVFIVVILAGYFLFEKFLKFD